MANHKSSLKRIRQTETKKTNNRYFAKTMRNAVRDFRALTDKKTAEEKFPGLVSLIDKNSKRLIIHKNKAGNLKSSLTKHLNELQ
ncbi:MAG TPA: 30S ribosomal protein S20 [Bacteroidales bacterium]|nr:30S ribosomal protein S20 [Bacteroidales bacterium]